MPTPCRGKDAESSATGEGTVQARLLNLERATERNEDALHDIAEDVQPKKLSTWKAAVEKMLKQNKENVSVCRKRVDDTRTEVAKHLVKVRTRAIEQCLSLSYATIAPHFSSVTDSRPSKQKLTVLRCRQSARTQQPCRSCKGCAWLWSRRT